MDWLVTVWQQSKISDRIYSKKTENMIITAYLTFTVALIWYCSVVITTQVLFPS